MKKQNPVRIVEKQSIPDAAGNGNIVTRAAGRLPIEKGNEPGEAVTLPMVNVTHGRNGHFYLPEGFGRKCDQCGQEYTAKRSTSKFCSGACRKAAFDDRRAARDAGLRP